MKRTLLFNLIFSFAFSQYATAQTFQWAKKMGSPYSQTWSLPFSDKGTSIAVDNDDNIIIGGLFKQTSDFDPGPNVFELTSMGGSDMFVTKLNASGDFLWAVSYGNDDPTGQGDHGVSVATDAAGNVYCTGSFKGTVDFDPSQNTSELTSDGTPDIFVTKLSPTGNFIWVKQIAGISSDYERTITIDPAGNICLTGSFGGTVDFDPGVGLFEISSVGAAPFPSPSTSDIFVCKLDSDGDFLWAKSMGGLSNDEGNSITTDNVGNIYFTGHFLSIADFDPSGGVFELTATGGRSPFVCKLDASGNLVWAKHFNSQGSAATGTPCSITLDASGNVYTTGFFAGMIDFDPGAGTLSMTHAGNNSATDAFVSKLDPSGNLVWAKQLGSVDDEEAYSILVDAMGDVYTVGFYQSTADFNPGPTVYNLNSVADSHDIFVSKLNSSGAFVWAKSIGGNSPSKDIAWSMTFNSSGNICITGQFYATADFNPAGGTYNLTSAGSSDIFVLLLDGFVVTGIDEISSAVDIGIVPNPTQGVFTLNTPERGDFMVINILGEVVYQNVVAMGATNIDLGKQPSGIYLYSYIGETGISSSGKIVLN